MQVLVTHIKKTGEVVGLGTVNEFIEDKRTFANQRTPKQDVFVAEIGTDIMNASDWYVKNGALAKRHEFNLVTDNGVITGIPVETAVRWPDGEETIESGELEFDSNVSGIFNFRFTKFTHFPLYLQVEYNV